MVRKVTISNRTGDTISFQYYGVPPLLSWPEFILQPNHKIDIPHLELFGGTIVFEISAGKTISQFFDWGDFDAFTELVVTKRGDSFFFNKVPRPKLSSSLLGRFSKWWKPVNEEALRMKFVKEALRMKSVKEEALRMKSVKEEALRMKSVKEEALRMKSVKGEALPMKSVKGEALPMKSVKEEALPMKSVKEEALPMKSVKEAALPMKSVKEAALPMKSVKEEALPMKSVKEEALPMKSVKEEALPMKSVKEEALPMKSVKEEALPMKSVKEEALPMKSVKEEALSRSLSSMILSTMENVKNEIILSDNTQTFECSTSTSHNLSPDGRDDLLFIDVLQKELVEMDNICEVSSSHETLSSLLHKEAGTIIFCCYDTNENQFEFYFKDSQDMASIVGVGLEYAKAILDKGCNIKVREILKMEWEQTLSRVQSIATSAFKSLKLELPRPGIIGGDTKFTERPLLWDLAKYFILKEVVAEFVNRTDGASSSNQPSSSEQTTPGNGGLGRVLFEMLKKLFFDKRGDRRDDNEGGENDEPEGDPSGPNHPGENCDTVVTVELLKGGTVVTASKLELLEGGTLVDASNASEEVMDFGAYGDDDKKMRLEVLDGTIFPNLEFKFRNHNGTKTIQSTIGDICFNLDKEEEWLHNSLKVSFGLGDEYQRYGEVERNSYKQLDLDPISGTERSNISRTLANRQGKTSAHSTGASARPQGIGATYKYDRTRSEDDTDSRQYDRSQERKCNHTKDGMEPKRFEEEHEIRCHYYSQSDCRDYQDLSPLSPLRLNQAVQFEGLWNVIEVHPQPRAFSAEYELMVSRILEEVHCESDGKSRVMNPASKGVTWKSVTSLFLKPFEGPKTVSEKQQIRCQWKFKQEYKKKILLNHEMTHLDGQHRKLREFPRQFGSGTFLAEKGRRDEYIWRNRLGGVIDPLATVQANDPLAPIQGP